MVKRFMAPGPWITRDLKECVIASDYDALAAENAALQQAVTILQAGNRARLEFLEHRRGRTAMDEYVDSAETAIADLRRELLTIREHAAALESREVCTVAHENVETCGYCQRDALTAENAALRSRLAEAESRLNLAESEVLMLRHFNAEADALLTEIAGHRPAVAFFAPQLAGVIAALDRIDAHLAREQKP